MIYSKACIIFFVKKFTNNVGGLQNLQIFKYHRGGGWSVREALSHFFVSDTSFYANH